MKIAIDVSPLQSGHKARGTGVYTRELVGALEKYGKKHQFTLVTSEQSLPKDADLVHYPYFDPFLPTLPWVKSKPSIVTVHDLIPLVFPDKFPKGIRGSLTWQIQKTSLKGSRRIITDSQNSKNDIQKIVGFDEEKIDVIPLAPQSIFRPIIDTSALLSVRKKYHLHKDFILYVGDVNWNKNISGLLRAFSAFRKSNPLHTESLVLVGSAFLNKTLVEVIEINKLMDELDVRPFVLMPGFVKDEDLAGIYSLATCIVQPSHYEGFGFPVLEAMACGCPVISSNASSLAEIAGPALRVKPDDVVGIAGLIKTMTELSGVKRNVLIKEGFNWVSKFTWQKVAQETIQSYERTLG